MLICPNCRRDFDEQDWSYCPFCGEVLMYKATFEQNEKINFEDDIAEDERVFENIEQEK